MIASSRLSLARFVAKVLAFGVVAFAAWYFAAKPLSLACAWIGGQVVESVAPVDHARSSYRDRVVVFAIEPDYQTSRLRSLPAGTYFETTVSALTYSYGLPFFVALMLASRARGLLAKTALGAGVILLAAGVGVAVDVLRDLMMMRTASGDAVFAFSIVAREAIALGYQLASLLLPPLLPVVLWAALDWKTVEALGR